MQGILLRSNACSSRNSIHPSALRMFRRHFHDPKPLPPMDEWRTHFHFNTAATRDRIMVRDPDAAARIAEGFTSGKSIAAGDNKVIIEAYPGPGVLSRALLQLPKSKVRKLIILEAVGQYYDYLKPLEEADPRVTVLQADGYNWESYNLIEEQGLLDDVVKQDWNAGVHPQLHFIAQLPSSVHGEQLVAQLFRSIPTRSWLFKYGRVPMSFVMNRFLWDRYIATPSTRYRGKVSVVAEASAQLQNAIRPSELEPYSDYFYPDVSGYSTKKSAQPQAAVNAVPTEYQLIGVEEMDQWDYVLRRLFVLKSTPLKKAIDSLAPGARSLLQVLTDPQLPPEERVNTSEKIRNLTIKDWALIVRAFKNWPFAPENLTMVDDYSQSDGRRI